jgi:hypothetical protein
VIGLRSELKVLVASRPIDFRRGVHGLVAMVMQALGADPYCGNVFVFRSKRKDRLKMIVWDGARGRRLHFSARSRRRGCPDGYAALGLGGRIGLDPGCSGSCEKADQDRLKRLRLLANQGIIC